MDKKFIIVGVVAVVAILAVAAVAVVLINKGGEKDYMADELAEKFIKDYSGKEFGEFKLSDGATKEKAELTCTCKTVTKDGSKEGTREEPSVIVITHYNNHDDAKKAFLDAITNSKNGSKGKTLLDQQDKLGMANKAVKIFDLREESASQFGADNAFLFYAAYVSDKKTTAQYTMVAGALLQGNCVISFNTSTNAVYYPYAISDATPITGEKLITVDEYEKLLTAFCKAF